MWLMQKLFGKARQGRGGGNIASARDVSVSANAGAFRSRECRHECAHTKIENLHQRQRPASGKRAREKKQARQHVAAVARKRASEADPSAWRVK